MNRVSFLGLLILLLSGCSKDTDPIIALDTTPPQISFIIAGVSESNNAEPIVVSTQLDITVDAQDIGGVYKVEAYINDQKVAEDTKAPYRLIIDITSYNSKGFTSAKLKLYSLRIKVTDTAGNISQQEQQLIIDNELPSITEVSLPVNSAIAGDANKVNFSVIDNENLVSVTTYINGQFHTELSAPPYSVNINTLELEDGSNTLSILAEDAAGNAVKYDVTFIADNTGPEIHLESLPDDNIIDVPITIDPEISDAYTKVLQVEFYLGETSQLTVEGEGPHTWDLDPGNSSTGAISLFIRAKDSLGNESEKEFPVQILRRLVILNFPEGYYDPQKERIYVFASDMNGKTLAIDEVDQNTRQIILNTSTDYNSSDEFMLTIATYYSGSVGNSSIFETIQNLNPGSDNIFDLKVQPRFEGFYTNPLYFPATGFDNDAEININASGFGISGNYNPESEQISIDRRRNISTPANSDYIYLIQHNRTANNYTYYLSDWEIAEDLVFTPNVFIEDGVEVRSVLTPSATFDHFRYWIAGYFSENDFQNNIYHRIDGGGIVGEGFSFPDGVPYFFNNIFEQFRYTFTLNTYYTERTGEPVNSIHPRDWTIDYTFSNKTFNLVKTGNGHTVGKASLNNDSNIAVINGLNVGYSWLIVFDSQEEQVILPELPEELQSWGFYSLYENEELEVRQLEIKNYEGLNSYNDYIQKVIQPNNLRYLVSPVMEAIYKSEIPVYYQSQHSSLID